MWTVVAYKKTLPRDTVQLTYLSPVFDDHVRVEDPNIIVPDELPFLAGVFFERDTSVLAEDRAQIEAPSLRRILLFDVAEEYVVGMADKYIGWCHMFDNPIPLEPREPLRAKATNFDSGAKDVYCYVFLSDGPQTSVGGEIYTVEAETEGDVVAGQWSTLKLNIKQVLPAGRYQLVGAEVISSFAGAYRFVFVGQPWRPGGLILYGRGVQKERIFRRGALGVWGEFTHDQPPSLQVLTPVSGVVAPVYLDLIKIE